LNRDVVRGAQRGRNTLENFSPLLEKYVRLYLQLLDSLKNLCPLRKTFLPPGFPSLYMSASSLCKNRGLI